MTASTSCGEANNVSSAGNATAGVPANRMRIASARHFGSHATGTAGHARYSAKPRVAWGETLTRTGSPAQSASRTARIANLRCSTSSRSMNKHPVEVVGLVLNAAREQVGAFDDDRFAELVEALGHGKK